MGTESAKAKRALELELRRLRAKLDEYFSTDTALPGSKMSPASSGHCAVVAVIVRDVFGGDYLSTRVNGESHWFNRVNWKGAVYDCDLTGDQYGFEGVRVAPLGTLQAPARIRSVDDVNAETRARAILLAKRAGLRLDVGQAAITTTPGQGGYSHHLG